MFFTASPPQAPYIFPTLGVHLIGALLNALGGAIVVHAPLSTVAVVMLPDTLVFPCLLNLLIRLLFLFLLEI